MNNENEEIETLDFDEESSNTEVIDLNDITDIKEEFKPTIKNFNLKNSKKVKIVKKIMLYVIIVMLLGFEFFINKTGEILNNLKVYASNNQPIRIVQNGKYGYIDYTGNKIVNPKYTYGENFIKGYAVVKNGSNLPLIIDRGGKEVIPTGNYFSIYRAENNIIASKVTKKGLKYGILNSDLRQITSFSYDSISYVGSCFTFVDGNSVGLINLSGKKIFEYKLTDKNDKKIDVAVPNYTNDKYVKYASVKVNSSYQIVNLTDGAVVYSPTLNEIIPEENNVFYESTITGSKRYIYVQDNKVLLESDDYTSLSISSIESGILKAINNNHTYEYISTKTLEQVKKDLNSNDVFEGDTIFTYKEHNYKKNNNTLVLIKNGEVYKRVDVNYDIHKGFKNGAAVIKYEDNTYGYINEKGDLITDTHYLYAGEFDTYGEAVCMTSSGYGVININGKKIIDYNNKDIKMASGIVKKETANDSNVFYAVKKENKYILLNSNARKVDKSYYDEVIFNENFPILKLSNDTKDIIMFSNGSYTVNLTSFNIDYQSFENYIIVKNEYYNYKGKLIYTDQSKESGE